ncbi:MAG: helix-turn-helix domain-containing protein [Candidatus Amesbacteria bacterium]|nr:helix-turn-helix domain-containing protein [Candidatus Amesbacteria bacterium]
MKSIGQLLQASRVAKKLDIADVARITKIRSQYLVALEADDYSQLPSNPVARGFIKNYAQFLNINVDQILAIFRRDFVENTDGKIVPRGFENPLEEFSFWTPKTTTIMIVVCLLTLFTSYLTYQYRIMVGAPTLTIMRPIDKYKTDQDTVEIVGATDPEAILSVNNQLVALDKGGTFRFRVPLTGESTTVTIVAASKYGKTRSQTLTVYNE